MKPYICADSAFALSPSVMKCYENVNPNREQFNYALIRTRRVVECSFGRLKKRFPILKHSRLPNPIFAGNVAMEDAFLYVNDHPTSSGQTRHHAYTPTLPLHSTILLSIKHAEQSARKKTQAYTDLHSRPRLAQQHIRHKACIAPLCELLQHAARQLARRARHSCKGGARGHRCWCARCILSPNGTVRPPCCPAYRPCGCFTTCGCYACFTCCSFKLHCIA